MWLGARFFVHGFNAYSNQPWRFQHHCYSDTTYNASTADTTHNISTADTNPNASTRGLPGIGHLGLG